MHPIKKPNIIVVTFPFNNKAGQIILKDFIAILEPLSRKITAISGNFPQASLATENISIIEIKYRYPTKDPIVLKIIKYLIMQIRVSFNLLKNLSNADIVIFFLGGAQFLLPLLVTKLIGKKTIAILTQSPSKLEKNINFSFFKRLIVYSKSFVQQYALERYHHKICIAHEHFIYFDKFKIKKKIDERDNLVGYIGRLSEEKGIMNFVKAIPEISKGKNEIRFLIGGDGQLQNKIEAYLDENNLNDKVKLAGWISHEELPDYLNKLKLIVLPSYTEGLPNVMLEGMACGTPVLATPVGAIPDVIKDGETGFIMEDNSPECIAKNVIRVLKHPNLDKIVKNAKEFVEREFSYDAAVEGYKKVLERII